MTATSQKNAPTEIPVPQPVQRVDKPWGHEEIFAVVEGGYVGKLLMVRAGESLSLQYHDEKDETISLVSGRAELDLGTAADALTAVPLQVGTSVHVPPGLLHRLRALDDSVFVEASTAAPGWRQDVVRLEDRYGRDGTTAP
jgi:mannose-6-phosphate isomerase